MSTRRKVLLVILVVVMIISGSVYLNKQANDQATGTENLGRDELENLSGDLDSLIKELERLIAQADASIETLQHLPQPTNEVKKSYHDAGHENAWIQDVDKKAGLVLVVTIDSKMSIIFKPTADNLQKFNIGWVAPVTFQCTKKKKGKCDFDAPYKLFVLNGPVEVKQLEFPKK